MSPSRGARTSRAPGIVTVSVVLPIYNSRRYLKEAIESVHAQTLRPVEVIVVDDGSTDGGGDIAEGLGARCLRQRNAGQAAARNAGARVARGDVLAFLDADDLWPPGKLAYQVGALEADPALDGVLGHAEAFVSPELPPEERARLNCPTGPLPAGLPGTLVVRAPAFARSGGFPDVRVAEFLAWTLRADEAGLRIAMLPGVVLRRRLHLDNTMRARRGEHGAYARLIKEALDRRRAAGNR
jgi:glycosyltransferase involved in cell wall biosynthesis